MSYGEILFEKIRSTSKISRKEIMRKTRDIAHEFCRCNNFTQFFLQYDIHSGYKAAFFNFSIIITQ